MKKDAHYFALLALARSVGIEKETAHKIAYASQFVDDARVNKITLHAYSDTFSHQVFSGIASKVNDVEAVRESNQIYISNFQLWKEKRW